jgi:hypothetical protein
MILSIPRLYDTARSSRPYDTKYYYSAIQLLSAKFYGRFKPRALNFSQIL